MLLSLLTQAAAPAEAPAAEEAAPATEAKTVRFVSVQSSFCLYACVPVGLIIAYMHFT
jgi:hypothetical protein